MEHRQGTRRRSLALLRIQRADGLDAVGLMHNASRDGMFVVTRAQVDINTPIQILLHVSEHAPPLRIPGFVIHKTHNGFGLTFRRLDEAARAFLDNLCNRYREMGHDRSKLQLEPAQRPGQDRTHAAATGS